MIFVIKPFELINLVRQLSEIVGVPQKDLQSEPQSYARHVLNTFVGNHSTVTYQTMFG